MEFCALLEKELYTWLAEKKQPSYRGEQLFHWVYQKAVTDWNLMANIPKELREKLRVSFRLSSLSLKKMMMSKDKETVKFLWTLSDGAEVESVLIYSGARRTVCISSQVGCPVRCVFCASGRRGLVRNLTTGEIVEQVVAINRYLYAYGEKVSHLVFMGMGEPFENCDSVIKSMKIFLHKKMLNFSPRRITISTVGIIEGLKRLFQEDIKVNLALSLHAPDQTLRKKLIPYAQKFPLDDLLLAMAQYAEKTKRDITYEYTLLAGINDEKAHAQKLSALLSGKQCTVNLIPYNPVPGLKWRRPKKEVIEQFRSILLRRGVNTTWRYTKGTDIAAACGQLALIV
jgi:23S rRNA (adenine2503-C2)-methyltransferase